MHNLNAHDLIEAMGNVLEQRIRNIVDEQVKHALVHSVSIEDYRDDIETIVSEYINYNVTITLEG
jgi:hypothetical protein